jgi:hypothetical protein
MPDQCYSFRFPDVTEPCTGTQINDFCDMAAFSEGLCVNRFRTAFVGETPYFGCSTTSGRQPTLGNWPNGSGMWEVSTPYGPGFQFISHDETEVESDGKKVELHGNNGPEIGTMGATYEFRGTAMFPPAYRPHASGRPQGERSSYGEVQRRPMQHRMRRRLWLRLRPRRGSLHLRMLRGCRRDTRATAQSNGQGDRLGGRTATRAGGDDVRSNPRARRAAAGSSGAEEGSAQDGERSAL